MRPRKTNMDFVMTRLFCDLVTAGLKRESWSGQIWRNGSLSYSWLACHSACHAQLEQTRELRTRSGCYQVSLVKLAQLETKFLMFIIVQLPIIEPHCVWGKLRSADDKILKCREAAEKMRNDASGSLEEERETGEEDTVIMVNNT